MFRSSPGYVRLLAGDVPLFTGYVTLLTGDVKILTGFVGA
jgi:hypothetical protein